MALDQVFDTVREKIRERFPDTEVYYNRNSNSGIWYCVRYMTCYNSDTRQWEAHKVLVVIDFYKWYKEMPSSLPYWPTEHEALWNSYPHEFGVENDTLR